MVSPYDAELYGHWWYEGPQFIDFLVRKVAFDQKVFRLATPGDYLRENPEQQLATPPLCSWGAGGYAGVWLDGSNDWIYRHLHKAAERMIALARDYPEPEAAGPARPQPGGARAPARAVLRLGLHHEDRHHGRLRHPAHPGARACASRGSTTRSARGTIDETWLDQVESRDNIFPEIDYRTYSPAI